MTSPFTQRIKVKVLTITLDCPADLSYYIFHLFFKCQFYYEVLQAAQFNVVKHPPKPWHCPFSSKSYFQRTYHIITHSIFYLSIFYCLFPPPPPQKGQTHLEWGHFAFVLFHVILPPRKVPSAWHLINI